MRVEVLSISAIIQHHPACKTYHNGIRISNFSNDNHRLLFQSPVVLTGVLHCRPLKFSSLFFYPVHRQLLGDVRLSSIPPPSVKPLFSVQQTSPLSLAVVSKTYRLMGRLTRSFISADTSPARSAPHRRALHNEGGGSTAVPTRSRAQRRSAPTRRCVWRARIAAASTA